MIGTNGAGKSTLINLLSGELAPSRGHASRSTAHDITRWPQPRRARAGIGRSYQRTTIFPEFTVLENCRLAAQARDAAAVDLSGERAALRRASVDAAHAARSTRPASTAAPARIAGDAQPRRQAPARDRDVPGDRAAVLLLDEPLAGMGAEETERMLALLADAQARRTRSCWSSTTWTRCSASPTGSR